MTTIFVFTTGYGEIAGPGASTTRMWTSCAITSKGKWIAGAVSQYPELANSRCAEMAERKGRTAISGEFKVMVVDAMGGSPVHQAVLKAFETMP